MASSAAASSSSICCASRATMLRGHTCRDARAVAVQAQHERARRARAGLDAVHVLGAAEHFEAIVALPEALARRHREPAHLGVAPRAALDAREEALERGTQFHHFGGGAVRIPGDRAQARAPHRGGRRQCDRGRRRVGIHELDRQRVAVCAHEQELVALGHTALDDGARERRQQVALEAALQRARAQVGGEAVVQQEVDGRLLDLDRPLAPAQAAARGRVGNFLL